MREETKSATRVPNLGLASFRVPRMKTISTTKDLAAAAEPRAGRLGWWRSFWRGSLGYWLLFPVLFIILATNLYPTFSGIISAFTDESLQNPDAARFIGFTNFLQLFRDPVFRLSLIHSAELTVGAVFLQLVLGLVLAHLLIQKVPGIHIFRGVAMVTWVLPTAASVVMFRFLTMPNIGLINELLQSLGFPGAVRNWFGDEFYAPLLVLIMHVWRNVPFYAITFMAAMQAIPIELYEAARIDGATPWKRFTNITLPNLRYIILVMVVLHVTFTFNNFDFVALSTGGGPANATEVLPTYIYRQAWAGFQLGLGSAGGLLMLLILLLAVFILYRLIGGLEEK